MEKVSEGKEENERWWIEEKSEHDDGALFLVKGGKTCGKVLDITEGNVLKRIKVSFLFIFTLNNFITAIVKFNGVMTMDFNVKATWTINFQLKLSR